MERHDYTLLYSWLKNVHTFLWYKISFQPHWCYKSSSPGWARVKNQSFIVWILFAQDTNHLTFLFEAAMSTRSSILLVFSFRCCSLRHVTCTSLKRRGWKWQLECCTEEKNMKWSPFLLFQTCICANTWVRHDFLFIMCTLKEIISTLLCIGSSLSKDARSLTWIKTECSEPAAQQPVILPLTILLVCSSQGGEAQRDECSYVSQETLILIAICHWSGLQMSRKVLINSVYSAVCWSENVAAWSGRAAVQYPSLSLMPN